jgi:hypothetical protein
MRKVGRLGRQNMARPRMTIGLVVVEGLVGFGQPSLLHFQRLGKTVSLSWV